jgi:TonB family protein
MIAVVALAAVTLAPIAAEWGDRFYGYGEAEGRIDLRTEIEEGFEGEPGWSCAMSGEDGLATIRGFDYSAGRALGLKVEFLRRSASTLLLRPPEPIPVEARCVLLSIRVLGRNYRHSLSLIVLDYYGRAHELGLGRLDFSGWKTLRAYVPMPDPATGRGIVQDDRHFPREAGLRIAGLKLSFEGEEAYGSFYSYFDDIEATIEGYDPGAWETEAPRGAAPGEAAVVLPEAPVAAANAVPEAREAPNAGSITAAGEGAAEAARKRILAELSRRIGEALVYPPAARRRGLEGTLVAAFSVGEGGELLDARLDRSSGSDILDAAGLELLRSVFPVENGSGTRLELRIAIGYKLE